MRIRRTRRTGTRSAATPHRIGLFGLLGTGNIGNDASLEAVLAHLRAQRPAAVLSALCGGPQRVRDRYGIEASPLHWHHDGRPAAGRLPVIASKALGKVVDAVRIAAWVRRQDVVIVPGMGVLEATLPLRPWGFPYALFLLCASGRLFGTKVALVSAGSDRIDQWAVRWLVTRSARLASYRSYRDELSRDSMRAMGVDTSGDEVYPDLAFALPSPSDVRAEPGTVAVGVMAYYGGHGDRARAEQVYRGYVDNLTEFVRWLVDRGRRVRLVTGDDVDQRVVDEILEDLRVRRPGLDPARVTVAGATTPDELMRQLAAVDSVVATRFHNVLFAVKLAKPTVSIGYAAKNDALMAYMGLGQFRQSATRIDLDLLVRQFTEVDALAAEPALHRTMAARSLAAADALQHQFRVLFETLLPGGPGAGAASADAQRPGMRPATQPPPAGPVAAARAAR